MLKSLICGSLIAWFVLASNIQSIADVQFDTSAVGLTVHITNSISQSDESAIAQRLAKFDRQTIHVALNSPGGDAIAAMKIGMLIRKYDGFVVVPQGAKCYSSCALIYIAGVTRFNLGVIGLHRPYFASTPRNRQEVEIKAPLMFQQVKMYIQQMGVTDNFYQEMINTDPSRIAMYRGDEIRRMACTRFRRHQVWCDNGTGGGSWSAGSLRGSSSLRLCA